jgi:hypothetical protein
MWAHRKADTFLCLPSDDNLKGKDRVVPGLQELFGNETLPGKVVR